LVEEKTAKELKKLFANLVDHTCGHHESIAGLTKRVVELERRVKNLEGRTKRGQPKS
jgi:polyhydroxyalkanoate synthesis regulator phasin